MPQGREIFPQLTVEENLQVGLGIRKLPAVPPRIYKLFPVLKDMKLRRGGDLSGGQQQQLAIGRALVLEPTLLSVDVSDAAPTPLSIREQRVRAVTQFIAGSQTAPALLPPTQPPAVATPAMAITIRVIPPKAD